MYFQPEPLTRYRFTSYLPPVGVLLVLPGFAAFDWSLPLGGALTPPFLTLLIFYFCVVRYPELILSPLLLPVGLATDLFTRSPMGYWTLLFILAFACALLTTRLVDSLGKAVGWLCFALTLFICAAAAWALWSLYLGGFQDGWRVAGALAMALLLFPLPVMLFVALEPLLIIKPERTLQGRHGAR